MSNGNPGVIHMMNGEQIWAGRFPRQYCYGPRFMAACHVVVAVVTADWGFVTCQNCLRQGIGRGWAGGNDRK